MIPGLLSTAKLDGSVHLDHVAVVAREAVGAVEGDLGSALREVQRLCLTWGGAGHVMFPFRHDSPNGVEQKWLEWVKTTHVDGAVGPDDEQLDHLGLSHPNSTTESVLDLAMALGESWSRISVPCLEDDDPWQVAYLGVIGAFPKSLGEGHGPQEIEGYSTLAKLVEVRFDEVTGSAADLVGRLNDFTVNTPRAFSLLALTLDGDRNDLQNWTRFVPGDKESSMHTTRSTVVVYEPGSVADLCLLWNLRAMHPRAEMPLAVPYGPETVSTLGELTGLIKVRPQFGLTLTSCSVTNPELEKLASELGANQSLRPSVEDWPSLMNVPGRPPGIEASTIAEFRNGSARVPSLLPEQSQKLEAWNRWTRREGAGLQTWISPRTEPLPVTARSPQGPVHFRYGGQIHPIWSFTSGGDFLVDWPSRWSMLQKAVSERGLEARPSEAGVVAEQLAQKLGSLGHLRLFMEPEVLDFMYRWSERTGMSWFRRRVREIQKRLGDEPSAIDLDRVLLSIAGEPSEYDQRFEPYAKIRNLIGPDVDDWLELLEQFDLVERGTALKCPKCRRKSWLTVAQIESTMECRQCGSELRHRGASLQWSFRASETLVSATHHDAIPHLLALDWFVTSYRLGSQRSSPQHRLIGGYPGVEFVDENNSVIGEADIALLFADGSICCGEAKRNPNGLKAEDLKKLDRLSKALASPWSFVTTPHPLSDCGTLWHEASADPTRLALTAEWLTHTRVLSINTNPFAEPPSEESAISAISPGTVAKYLTQRRDEDQDFRRRP